MIQDPMAGRILDFFQGTREVVLASEVFQWWKQGLPHGIYDGKTLYVVNQGAILQTEDELILDWASTNNIVPESYVVRLSPLYSESQIQDAQEKEREILIRLNKHSHLYRRTDFEQWLVENNFTSNVLIVNQLSSGNLIVFCRDEFLETLESAPGVIRVFSNKPERVVNTELSPVNTPFWQRT